MFQIEQLSRTSLFSECRFYTPFYSSQVSGLTLYEEMEAQPCKGHFILIRGAEMETASRGLPDTLNRVQSRLAAGLIVSPGAMGGKALEAAAAECAKRRLIFGEMSRLASFTSLIREFYNYMPSQVTGEICSYEEVFARLQSTFFSRGLDPLLEELHSWTGCQTALVFGQDTYVYPQTPLLDPSLFYPVYWRKGEAQPYFTHVRQYASARPPGLILQSDLYKDGLPSGMLFLIGNGNAFKKTDYFLLNYASVLCTGLNGLNRRSRRIDSAIRALSQGELPPREELELLPKSGYAVALNRFKGPGMGEEAAGTEEYLSYLIHYHFPREVCYSFNKEELLVFIDTADVENSSKKLVSLLNKTGRSYHVGVSRRYGREQASTAFSEALHAVKMAALLDFGQAPCFFKELGIYRLFSYPEYPWSVDQMLGEMDRLLDDLDGEKKDTLTLTVRTFVKNNFNYQKTADELYTHVNTIRYRIRQLEELWDTDLASKEGRLLFSVLAKLLPLWMQNYPVYKKAEEETKTTC